MRKIRFPDLFVILSVIILFILGVFVLYSTEPLTAVKNSWVDSLVIRQILFFLFATLISVWLMLTDPQIGKTLLFQSILFVGSILLLAGLFLLGPLLNGTKRWFLIGNFLFQPSEFVKIITVLWTAFWLVKNGSLWEKLVFGGGGIAGIILLILIQPDFGASIIISVSMATVFLVWVLKYKIGRILLGWLALSLIIILAAINTSLFLLLLLLLPLLYLIRTNYKAAIYAISISGILFLSIGGIGLAWKINIIPQYVKSRVLDFSSGDEQFQTRQAKIAIGSGRLKGKGVAQGTQSRLQFLPEYTTDFIFAAYAEERGFVGVLLLLGIYSFLFLRLLYLALTVDDEYAKLVIIGLTTKLWFETLVNIGMNMGIMPTKGVALPFMSYGGSSLLSNAIIIGIILSLYRFEAKRATI